MEQDHLLIEAEGPILTLTLNRPERLNSFSEEMITSLTEALREAQNSGEIKVIILKGAGRSFSAGGDVKTMGQATPQDVYEHIGKLNRCILTMKETEIPIIAAVHGFAAGAGFNLAMACDLIVAPRTANLRSAFHRWV